MPVPDREIARFESEAFEITDMMPLALIEELGAKTTPKVKLCPGVKVRGRFNPLTLKPVPVIGAWLTVTLEPPELVSVSDRVWLLPTPRLPKLMLEGFGLSVPVVTPVPERGTVSVGSDALLVRERFPLADPPDCGVNTALKVAV